MSIEREIYKMFTIIMLIILGMELGVTNPWFYGLGVAVIVVQTFVIIFKVAKEYYEKNY